MLEKLKNDVCKANLELVERGLVIHTWGNVSGKDKKSGLIVIKPSGVSYKSMKADDMVVIDEEGTLVEGKYKPSTDALTHLLLYRTYESLGGVVHTHSSYATCLLYTSPSPRDRTRARMPSSACNKISTRTHT